MKYVVGIDEVGRGPLAGPVTVCVVACQENFYKKLKRSKLLPKRGLDSKKLSPMSRQTYTEALKSLVSSRVLDTRSLMSKGIFDMRFSYAVVHVSNKVIDKKGISFAIKKAIGQGIEKLKLKPKKCKLLLDGGLSAPTEFTNQKTIIKGDEKEKIIAWASILAKTSRDSLMGRMGKIFPKYGFEKHKGYATRAHREAISENGCSTFHRLTWIIK